MLRVAYWLNLRQVRRRPLRAVLAIISIAAGASLGVSVVVHDLERLLDPP